MEIGITNQIKAVVSNQMTAREMGSGDLPVLATPSMIALMEGAANGSVATELHSGQGTVGLYIEVSHLAPVPIGGQIDIKSILIEVNKKILTFEVSAFYGETIIGKGIHKRAIIDNGAFMEKVHRSTT